MPLKIVSRNKWGALPPKKSVPMQHPILYLCFSTIEEVNIFDAEIVKKVQILHMDTREHDDIDCSFVIGQDGTVYEGRGWFTQTEFRVEEGGNYLEIGFIGQVRGKSIEDPPLAALTKLLDFGVDKNYLDKDYLLFGDKGDGRHQDFTYDPLQDSQEEEIS